MGKVTIHLGWKVVAGGGAKWAALLRSGQHERLIHGHIPEADNTILSYQAAAQAALEGLQSLRIACEVDIRAPTTYLVQSASMIDTWRKSGWMGNYKRGSREQILNVGIWQEISNVIREGQHSVKWTNTRTLETGPDLYDVKAETAAMDFAQKPLETNIQTAGFR